MCYHSTESACSVAVYYVTSDERDCAHLASNPVTVPWIGTLSLLLIMISSLIVCSAEIHARRDQEAVAQILLYTFLPLAQICLQH